jgi:hypothetical protein
MDAAASLLVVPTEPRVRAVVEDSGYAELVNTCLAATYRLRSETYFVPGAEHVRAYETDPAQYLARVDSFFERAETAAVSYQEI